MNDIYRIEICRLGKGLCNQLFAVISGILLAFSHRKHRVAIEAFQKDFSVYSFSDISDILDLDKMNTLLIERYNLRVCDAVHIRSDMHDTPLWYTYEWITNINKAEFDIVLSYIRFHEYFIQKATKFIDRLDLTRPVNVIHLRIEDDWIKYKCSQTGLPFDEMRKLQADKYIDVITRHIKKTETTIILSSSTNNIVTQFMDDNGYAYCFTDKNPSIERELNAIVDTIVSESCNNVFIGDFNFKIVMGSSFTYFVVKRLSKNVKCIMIDQPNVIHIAGDV
jgi:hypothetical protein